MAPRRANRQVTVDVPCPIGSELYAKLRKNFACPGLPTDGMRIGFKCRRVSAGKDAASYSKLVCRTRAA
jgi:hypothetical protein